MMKVHFIVLPLILLLLCSSCSQKHETSATKIDDDYVLVEFASKLEEDFHRINNQPTDNNENMNGQHP